MRYISLDIETTGLDIPGCDLLEVGAIIDDFVTPLEELPCFHRYVTKNGLYVGEPFALHLNAEIFKRIANKGPEYRYADSAEVPRLFNDWLIDNGLQGRRVVFAGKNAAGFDLPFLDKYGFKQKVLRSHRTLDVGSLYFDPTKDDQPPSLNDCLKRAGIEKTVAHTAVEDAMDVVRLIRHYYGRAKKE